MISKPQVRQGGEAPIQAWTLDGATYHRWSPESPPERRKVFDAEPVLDLLERVAVDAKIFKRSKREDNCPCDLCQALLTLETLLLEHGRSIQ